MRKTLDETWRLLEALGHDMPRTPDGAPHVAAAMPNFDDDAPVNIAFFRTVWEGADLSGLTLRRTYFGRSSFTRVDFRGTDLSESRMCWNEFVGCDFSNADLRRCDLRAVDFRQCLFRDADLSGADLRRSPFDACIFEGAKLTGAVAHTRSAADDLVPLLSKSQRDEIRWVDDLGPEPPGG
jgi:uncharacterized protein YjbI with pentapeptide repeats